MKRLPFAILLFAMVACQRGETAPAAAAASPAPVGNMDRGKELITQYGCNVCHTIPGISGPQGTLGPALTGVASRPSISMGKVQNTPENLVQFIQNPSSMNPQSAMPPIGLPAGDSRDIAAYLLTLK